MDENELSKRIVGCVIEFSNEVGSVFGLFIPYQESCFLIWSFVRQSF